MPGGRPTVMTGETVQKLEQAFLMGCTDREACLYAGIVPSTLYNYCKEHPEFLERKETLKENPFMLARGVLLQSLQEGDANTAHRVIDRKEGKKLALTGADDGPLQFERVMRLVKPDE